METYKVIEVFDSIQFEGFWSGIAARFVRFKGCNLNCSWCDTPQKDNLGEEMSLETLAHRIVEELSFNHVILTGGEPTLQPLEQLLHVLRADDIFPIQIHIETNGTQPDMLKLCRQNEDTLLHWITVSPKEEVDLTCYMKLADNNLVSEFKIIYPYTPLKEFAEWLEKNHPEIPIFLQPRWYHFLRTQMEEAVYEIFKIQKEYPQIRCSF